MKNNTKRNHVKLDVETWENILNNLQENNEETEILYLDSQNHFALCSDNDLSGDIFEEGFQTEEDARNRLNEIYNKIL